MQVSVCFVIKIYRTSQKIQWQKGHILGISEENFKPGKIHTYAASPTHPMINFLAEWYKIAPPLRELWERLGFSGNPLTDRGNGPCMPPCTKTAIVLCCCMGMGKKYLCDCLLNLPVRAWDNPACRKCPIRNLNQNPISGIAVFFFTD